MIKTIMIVIAMSGGLTPTPSVEGIHFDSNEACEAAKIQVLAGVKDMNVLCVPAGIVSSPTIDEDEEVAKEMDVKGAKAIATVTLINKSYDRLPYDKKGDMTKEELASWFVNDFRPMMNELRE